MFQSREIPEISPEDLVRTIEGGGRIRILDIRAPQALAGGRIDLGTPEQFLNMRGSCSGCPSSTATLKHGIENLLRHFIPEITEVRPV